QLRHGTSQSWSRRVAIGGCSIDLLNGLERVGLSGGLVGPVSFHPRKSKRERSWILRALLHIVECNLDDQLWTNVDGMGIAPGFTLEQRGRLPFQQVVGQSFERLPQLHEAAALRIPRA